jgi:hypothetical protein
LILLIFCLLMVGIFLAPPVLCNNTVMTYIVDNQKKIEIERHFYGQLQPLKENLYTSH